MKRPAPLPVPARAARPAAGPRPLLDPDVAIGNARVEAMSASIVVGAAAAAASAFFLAAGLVFMGLAAPGRAFAWAFVLCFCALCNIALARLYRRAAPVGDRWRVWAYGITAINFCVGAALGWAPLGLAAGGPADAEFLILLTMLSCGAGSIPIFSPYLPAFLLFFAPAVLPYTIGIFYASDPVLHTIGPPLMLIWVVGIGGLGLRASRSFDQLVRLRLGAEQMAADLQRQKDVADAANRAKSSFLAAASHDLRQPVHALGLFVGALRGVAMAREGERLVTQIEASIHALDGLFTALLDISRLDAGVVEVQRRTFAIQPLVDRVCRDYVGEAQAKGVSLTRANSSAVIESDPVLVERILRNLVSNAVRYTDRGGVLVGCRRRGEAVTLQVCDTGIGIAEEHQPRVFQEYYQLGNPERDRAKGLGLGLAIVRRLADLMDCRLTLRSEPGRGSCFDLTLPLAKGPAEDDDHGRGDFPAASQRWLILVVDDEFAIREAMSSLLTSWGHRVVAARSADDAIAQLSPYPMRPDLMICDYRLPGEENGVDVIERLRSEYNETIPAMLVTGDTAPGRLADAEASGLLLLHKPVANSRLRAAMFNLIGASESEGADESDVTSLK